MPTTLTNKPPKGFYVSKEEKEAIAEGTKVKRWYFNKPVLSSSNTTLLNREGKLLHWSEKYRHLFTNVSRGDVIIFTKLDQYRNHNVAFWDGEKIVPPEDGFDDEGTVPLSFADLNKPFEYWREVVMPDSTQPFDLSLLPKEEQVIHKLTYKYKEKKLDLWGYLRNDHFLVAGESEEDARKNLFKGPVLCHLAPEDLFTSPRMFVYWAPKGTCGFDNPKMKLYLDDETVDRDADLYKALSLQKSETSLFVLSHPVSFWTDAFWKGEEDSESEESDSDSN